MFAIVLCLATLYQVYKGQITLSDTFDRALLMVLSFYFANKGDTNSNSSYLGK